MCFDSLMAYLALQRDFLPVLEGTSYSRDKEH